MWRVDLPATYFVCFLHRSHLPIIHLYEAFLTSFTRFWLWAVTLLVLLLGASLRAQAQAIRCVKPTATGTGSSNSWVNASGDLQAMINASSSGQQVWVAAGTYKPTGTPAAPGTDRTVSFSMKNGVAIYGGFAASETTLAQRNPTSLTTVLSGNIGNVGSNTDNTFNMFNHPRELTLNNTAVLDGFIIRDGYDTDLNSYGFYGGGMYNDHSSPTIANCNFVDNTSFLGGGMYNNGTSNPGLTNCSFQGNTAINTGGGIGNNGTSNPILTTCSFVGNSSVDNGGGMYNQDSDPSLTNCVLFGRRRSGWQPASLQW